jgi:uncharacterized LabA/DUF88 family protein
MGTHMRKVVFMIDGWFMRKRIYLLKSFDYNGKKIREYCLKHLNSNKGDRIYRIFYYDTEPLKQTGPNPITGKQVNFGTTRVALEQEKLLDSIRNTPNFALRLGNTQWSGKNWTLHPEKFRGLIKKEILVDDLTELDVKPVIEQKAVDMKIGLDIALISMKKLADLLVIITGDADFVPALKFARREGMQVLLDPLRSQVQPELKEHADFVATKIVDRSTPIPPKKDTTK